MATPSYYDKAKAAVTTGAGAVTAGAGATFAWGKSFFGESAIGPIAIVSLPLVLSICTLQSVANKDSVNNYTIVWLIFGASYLIGILSYGLLLQLSLSKEQLLYFLLFVTMACFAMAVASGGVAAISTDALSTAKSGPSK